MSGMDLIIDLTMFMIMVMVMVLIVITLMAIEKDHISSP